MRRKLTILGSTGSIGRSTLDVVRRHRERFSVHALCAHRQVEVLAGQCREFRPQLAVIGDPADAARLRGLLAGAQLPTRVACGVGALCEAAAAPAADTVMAAIVGAAGLLPTLAAVRAGKRVLLANKEALVMAGPIFVAAVRQHRATLLPIDSEHNAVFQALPDGYDGEPRRAGVRRILLTASGGPFRDAPLASLGAVTPEAACAHPNWVMGRKISVDSATMMNKGLEVIEAHYLFDAPATAIEVVVHPQSVIHSLVDYVDGSVIAQLGNPDMRTPIAHALAHPERIDSGVAPLDLFAVARLDFERPDAQRFPCLALAYRALAAGGSAPAVLNAANEVAVAAFLERRLPFTAIAAVVEATLDALPALPVTDLPAVQAVDEEARRLAGEQVRRRGGQIPGRPVS
jgi:1-deoxy-D-xylulose-5-phosphate reductoisomerase